MSGIFSRNKQEETKKKTKEEKTKEEKIADFIDKLRNHLKNPLNNYLDLNIQRELSTFFTQNKKYVQIANLLSIPIKDNVITFISGVKKFSGFKKRSYYSDIRFELHNELKKFFNEEAILTELNLERLIKINISNQIKNINETLNDEAKHGKIISLSMNINEKKCDEACINYLYLIFDLDNEKINKSIDKLCDNIGYDVIIQQLTSLGVNIYSELINILSNKEHNNYNKVKVLDRILRRKLYRDFNKTLSQREKNILNENKKLTGSKNDMLKILLGFKIAETSETSETSELSELQNNFNQYAILYDFVKSSDLVYDITSLTNKRDSYDEETQKLIKQLNLNPNEYILFYKGTDTRLYLGSLDDETIKKQFEDEITLEKQTEEDEKEEETEEELSKASTEDIIYYNLPIESPSDLYYRDNILLFSPLEKKEGGKNKRKNNNKKTDNKKTQKKKKQLKKYVKL